jgi:hypothetical protein
MFPADCSCTTRGLVVVNYAMHGFSGIQMTESARRQVALFVQQSCGFNTQQDLCTDLRPRRPGVQVLAYEY